MPKRPSEVILNYLVRVDGFLSRSVHLVVIGGFAIALGWTDKHSTSDIDVLGSLDPELEAAIQAAGPDDAIPIQLVTVGSQPYDFEDRLQPVDLPGVINLQVSIPEAHDLAIMKLARGLSHDLDGIEAIHRETPLVLDVLIERYHETDYIGKPGDFRFALLATIARLFGEEIAEEVNRTLP